MPTFATPSLTYYYETYGAGKPLLLLHGFTGQTENWASIVQALRETHRLIALDLPGHGRSDAPSDPSPYAMPAVARDVKALLDHLDIVRAHLLGYSMGGRLALYLALHDPQRWHSLILESASPGLPTAREGRARVQQDEALAAFIQEHGIEPFVRRWEALPLFASQQNLPPAVRMAHRAARLRNRPTGLANSLRGMGTGTQPSLWDQLSALDMPVLLITGNLDQKFVNIARQMVARLPRARLEIVPHAGHTVHLERPQDYSDIVARWLRQRDHPPPRAEQDTLSRQ